LLHSIDSAHSLCLRQSKKAFATLQLLKQLSLPTHYCWYPFP